MGEFKIVEGISGVWHYHLARADQRPEYALCGATTMPTTIPLEGWGRHSPHIRSSYCKTCAELAGLDKELPHA